jgi:hypothetical protein
MGAAILAQAELGKPVIDSGCFPIQLTVLGTSGRVLNQFKTPLSHCRGILQNMACANQELGTQVGNVNDPITDDISGRDFAILAAECEDIAVEICDFYKREFTQGVEGMLAIPSDLVLMEARYFYMKRKKIRFEKMRAKMLAFQPEPPPPFQNAPPPPFQVQNAPRAAVASNEIHASPSEQRAPPHASNEKRASPSEQRAPPPAAVKERTKKKQMRIERFADQQLARICNGRPAEQHYQAVKNCLDIIRTLPDRFAWVGFAKTNDIQRKQHWFCAFGLDAIQTTGDTLKAADITYAYTAFCRLHQCSDLADGTANYFTQYPQWLVALWKVGEVAVESGSFQFRTLCAFWRAILPRIHKLLQASTRWLLEARTEPTDALALALARAALSRIREDDVDWPLMGDDVDVECLLHWIPPVVLSQMPIRASTLGDD